MRMAETFSVCSGTCIGSEHIGSGGVLSAGNNQDACAHHMQPEYLAAVVCDGCSDRPDSGIGANLLARIFIDTVGACVAYEEGFISRLNDKMLGRMRAIVDILGGSRKGVSQVADEIFLATLVGVVMTPQSTKIVACGDGMWGLNGSVATLGPFESNEPPYLGYQVRDGRNPRNELKLVHQIPTDEVNSVFIGSDGCAYLKTHLSTFLTDGRFLQNPALMSRELRVLNQDKVSLDVDRGPQSLTVRPTWKERLLPDDTTLVVVKRKQRRIEPPKKSGMRSANQVQVKGQSAPDARSTGGNASQSPLKEWLESFLY